MTAFPSIAAALMAVLCQSATAACFVVYGPGKDIVYRATEPPVDMSRPIHESLPLVAPGATLVFSPDSFGCEVTVNKLPLVAASASMPGALGQRPARADRR